VSAPLVGIVGYHLVLGRVTGWRQGAYAVPENYVDSVRRAGGLPVVVDPKDVDLDRFAAIVLVGGGDIDPGAYGGPPHDAIYMVDPDRDNAEFALTHEVIHRGIPTLAICRGIQVLNIAFGGTLHPHVPDLDGVGNHGIPGGEPAEHDVKLDPGSLIAKAAGADLISVSSHHHQAVDCVGDGLAVVGRAPDGLIEALELANANSWLVAVQWHPEDTAAVDASNQGLFDGLVQAAVK
jgi:gamma-glutamyl-gamma-aminobutyrate hydrolase PuuD